jgi:DNA-directed RNA polymerase subunit M/transcription elongation factor TFIIS
MEIIEAEKVFSKIDFQDDIDYDIYPKSIYECPFCKYQLMFNMQNFKKYSLNKKSVFSIERQNSITKFINVVKRKEPNSFIDFYCPQCNAQTRLYFTTWFGGRFTCAFHIEFIVTESALFPSS